MPAHAPDSSCNGALSDGFPKTDLSFNFSGNASQAFLFFTFGAVYCRFYHPFCFGSRFLTGLRDEMLAFLLRI